MDVKTPALIYDYANRGSLQDIILKKDIKLDWNFKWSMLNDLCRGMRYIHHSSIKYHGNLKSRNCVVDSRWVLKLTDFGLPNVYSNQNFSRTLNLSDLLWTAPEHLRQTTIRDQVIISIGSQTGDIYSFGIIMQEVIVRGTPFCMMGLSEEEIIGKIRKPPPLLRPSVSKTAAPPEYVNIMRDCWSEQPELRPSFDQLASMFKSLNGEKKVNIVDLMFKMIEQYTNNLEELVREKTEKLEEEKKKFEKLLSEMLPKTVAESLMSGESVPPEQFDMVTIYFSDIVGFTTISAFSSPIEVVTLLNDLYTMFDETINELRIGLHSGACVTGVVGLKMPRYCLFGDTVNTASRMESTSQAYRIHVSESCADILDEIGGYHLEFRGVTELKGKGMHKTFWLTGKDGFEKQLPEPFISEKNHGVDDQLIEQIKKIVAERQVQKLDEDVHQNEAKINSVPTISADTNYSFFGLKFIFYRKGKTNLSDYNNLFLKKNLFLAILTPSNLVNKSFNMAQI
ncbi:retinal guanylyl cyclase 2 [Brachionus plicatilis]|uniref:Guanylate cyclase n=1 Tax=Brachionus plicatilis TaxID=10195 RepID=A0A3M7T8S1_BRAPC|nr:retinal guanylyl cyclase 2 [Brachionus plicatilis]